MICAAEGEVMTGERAAAACRGWIVLFVCLLATCYAPPRELEPKPRPFGVCVLEPEPGAELLGPAAAGDVFEPVCWTGLFAAPCEGRVECGWLGLCRCACEVEPDECGETATGFRHYGGPERASVCEAGRCVWGRS